MSLNLMCDVMHDLAQNGAVAHTVLNRYEHDPGSTRFLRASSNFVFTFTAQSVPRVLRFNHVRERRSDVVQAEIDLIRHLGSRGVLTAQPVISRVGHEVEVVPTKLGTFSVVAFDFISGTQPESNELSESMFARWGTALATLHNAVVGHQASGRPSWHDHLGFIREYLPAKATLAREMLRSVSRKLEALPINKDTFGLIHFDFEPDNLIWQAEQVWAIDFDDCAYYWFAADMAFALRDLFHDRPSGVDLDDNRVRAFVSGYRDMRGMSDEELSALPLFLAAHNLLMYARLRRSLGDAPDTEEPEWLGGLRRRLKSKVVAYEADFADTSL